MLFLPLLPVVVAFEAMVVFKVAVAAFSTDAFARVLGRGTIASLAAAVVFAFGPFLPHDISSCSAPMASEPTSAVRESAHFTRYEPDALTIETDGTSPGLLAMSEVHSGGGRATVDGGDMEVLPTNQALRGVPLPAGKHLIELRYDPWTPRLGIPISAVSSVRFRRHGRVGAHVAGGDPARGR